jgi:hypothetical protein
MAEREGRSAAQAAAEQVRAIVEAAEQTAASLEAAAREEAERIRAAAEADVAARREAAERVTERAGELERRLDELVDGVRTAVAALKAELDAVRAVGAGESREPADVDPAIAEAEAVSARAPEVVEEVDEAAPAVGEDVAEAPPEAAAPEGARVLALKMALDGTPRDETARYLRENFQLDDPEALLDEVYARAGG